MSDCSPWIEKAYSHLKEHFGIHTMPSKDYLRFPYCPDHIDVADTEDKITIRKESIFLDKNGKWIGSDVQAVYITCYKDNDCRISDQKGDILKISRDSFQSAKRWLLEYYVAGK